MANVTRRRSSFIRGRSSGRQTEWLASADVSAGVAVAAATLVFDSSMAVGELAKRPFTITRVRGIMAVRSSQVAALQDQFGALGFAVVSDEAVAVGVSALPAPITNEQSDLFFVWLPFAQSQGVSSSGAGIFSVSYQLDSKAQRKVEPGQDIVVVVENASASTAFTYFLKWRMLIKTH